MLKSFSVRQPKFQSFFLCLALTFFLIACQEQGNTVSTPATVQAEAQATAGEAVAEITSTATATTLPSPTSSPTATALPPTTTQPPPTATAVPSTPTLPPLPAPQVDTEIAAWQQANVVPFDTAVPSDSYEDLLPLKEMIGDARIVSLGEATHGTKEFFQMKHRLAQFLVEEMDFNVFAIEASWVNSQAVNQYIQTGGGTAEEAVGNMGFWTWNTQEVVEMVSWMRQYNEEAERDELLQFAGVDPQLHESAVDQVIAYLDEVDPEARAEVIPNLQCFRRLNIYLERTETEKADCQANLQHGF